MAKESAKSEKEIKAMTLKNCAFSQFQFNFSFFFEGKWVIDKSFVARANAQNNLCMVLISNVDVIESLKTTTRQRVVIIDVIHC